MANPDWCQWMRTRLLATSSGLLLAHAAASGGVLEVTPTLLQIATRQNADGVQLSNTGEGAIRAQVRVYAWTQQNGDDLLTPTRALIASPPLLHIAPGRTQLLRVIRAFGPVPVVEELAYRLIIDELPSSPVPSVPPKQADTTAISFRMRYSLPVFVGDAPTASVAPQLAWSFESTGRHWTLHATSSARSHAQIADLQAVLADGSRRMLFPGLLGYVLAGRSMQWSMPALTQPGSPIVSFEAMINRDTRTLDVNTP